MLQSAHQIRGSKVFDSQGHLLCKIKRAVIDPNNGQVLGFITNLPRPINILSLIDVVTWKKQYLLLGQHHEFHQPSELIRIDRALKNQSDLIHRKVKTENQQYLGRVIDYTLDLKQHLLAHITVQKKLFGFLPSFIGNRIIHQKNILDISPRFITVRDTTIKIPISQNIPEKSAQHSPAT